ncbi:MAG: hypothetical protein RLO18_02520, partial [Gimesia chilikensis]
ASSQARTSMSLSTSRMACTSEAFFRPQTPLETSRMLYHVTDPFNVQIMHYEPYRHPDTSTSLLELEHVSI